MTKEEADKITDMLVELVEEATQAVRDGNIDLAEAKIERAHEIVQSLKKEPRQ